MVSSSKGRSHLNHKKHTDEQIEFVKKKKLLKGYPNIKAIILEMTIPVFFFYYYVIVENVTKSTRRYIGPLRVNVTSI